MQFTRKVSKESTEQKAFVQRLTSFEELIKRIQNKKHTPYAILDGETLSAADYECIMDFEQLKKLEQAVVAETYVDKMLALELIQKIEQETTHLRQFPEFLSVKQNLKDAFTFDLWPPAFTTTGPMVRKVQPHKEDDIDKDLKAIMAKYITWRKAAAKEVSTKDIRLIFQNGIKVGMCSIDLDWIFHLQDISQTVFIYSKI